MSRKMPLFPFLEKTANTLSRAGAVLGAYCTLVMAIIITYDVLMRYLFAKPTIWVFETSEYLMAIVVFCGAGYCLLKDSHVTVDLVLSRFPRKLRSVIELINSFFALGFCVIFTWMGWKFWWPAYVNVM